MYSNCFFCGCWIHLTLYQTTKFQTGPNSKHLQKKKTVTENFKFVMGTVENFMEKGESAGYQHVLLFSQCFLKGSSAGSLKVVIVWERVNAVQVHPLNPE